MNLEEDKNLIDIKTNKELGNAISFIHKIFWSLGFIEKLTKIVYLAGRSR